MTHGTLVSFLPLEVLPQKQWKVVTNRSKEIPPNVLGKSSICSIHWIYRLLIYLPSTRYLITSHILNLLPVNSLKQYVTFKNLGSCLLQISHFLVHESKIGKQGLGAGRGRQNL